MKKTLIICGSIVLAAVIVLVLVLVLKGEEPALDKKFDKGDKVYELPDMTYEEFTKGMSRTLSREVQTEVDALFEQYQSADQQRRTEIFNELFNLGVYEGKSMDKGEYDKGDKTQYDKN